ncbi:hypothetical protein [Actinacidiphila bryophytorum]|uniref:Uncharacterized protein n=1 Tax=Actinacidiphila bryophytorum TaxID=1436133 RepID=A0A9W4E4D1_9ACTN|nr:hypothetical protein [Actinacidiphila bryophytorum]MBM9434455.1 hypothetical protein [Actinacidiphila bryophytorum]MBN6541929.1 hypothetical protein [Actinacidiphila bryophytorum]CAG7626294.1 conserved hypothetical protein [Actinacidiphila bryophytorum]
MATQHFWTWRGKFFGYRSGDNLYTHRGQHVGKFYGEEIYGVDGRYLGEVMNDDRLITHKSKKAWAKPAFGPIRGSLYTKYANYAGYAMYAGYEDFPLAETF